MLKKYDQFKQRGTLGDYIESIAKKDKLVKVLVDRYIGESINVSSDINNLDDLDQVDLLRQVENINIEVYESYGKSVLSTFFKCLTALGCKDTDQQTTEVPSEFLIFFKFSGVDSSKIESVFKRFKSLSSIQIDYTHPSMGLYFGIRCTGDFEYGYYYDELVPIGTFKLNRGSFNSLKLSEFKSASPLKRLLVNLSLNDILLMGKIKTEMDKFNPGHFDQKMTPIACLGGNKLISFGYYGYGRWDNGQLNPEDKLKITSDIKLFLSKFRWSDKILVSVGPDKFWIYINIKIKE